MVRAREVIAVAALALLMLGVVMVNSASMWVSPVAIDGGGPDLGVSPDQVSLWSILTGRSAIYMLLACGAFVVGCVLPVRLLAAGVEDERDATFGGSLVALVGVFLAVAALLLAVYLPGIGHAVNGSHRWLKVPGMGTFQPSELVKWGLIVVLAVYAARVAGRLHRFFTGLLPALTLLGLVCALIAIEDLGTGVLIASAGILILIAGGARLWQFALMAPAGVAAVVALIIHSPYRVRRLTSFLDPYADPQGDGYHMIQSLATIAGGGPFGRGLGHGLQKFGYLPEDTTDFVFAIICEELGLAGAMIVVTLYALLVGAVLAVAQRATSPILRLVALGVGATIAMQATINLFVVTGLGPTKGIALPLLSSGGTGWILTALMLGIVASIDRATERDRAARPIRLDEDTPARPRKTRPVPA